MAGNPFTSAQAPAAMQMLAPDIAAEQMKLARQQQMADLLRQQSMAPMGGTETVNGWAIKRSPWESIAKLGQALAGSSMQSRADDKQLALAKAMQERMGDAFDKMSGGDQGRTAPGQPPAAQPDASQPAMAASSAPAQTLPIDPAGGQNAPPLGAAPMATPTPTPPAAPAAPMTQEQRIRNQAKAAYMMGNTELANKLLENISTLTNEQRNMAATGQDPLLMGRLATAAARKAGIIELQPGTTALDLSNGQERFQPKVGEGITLNGGQASAIPGYAVANAEIAGASAGATAGANAKHKLITVNTQGGPVMMTEEQAAQISGGTAPQTGTHFQNPGTGASLDFKGSPQATFDVLSKLPPGPDREQALAAFSQYANQAPGATAPAGGVGIPLRTPEQEAQLAADVKLRTDPQIAQKTQEYKDMADYGKTLDGHVSESQALLQRISESRDALTKFKAGGGADTRTNLAKLAQSFGMPDALVNKIGNGDLAASQVFQKFAAQEALGTMQQALASDSGKGAQGNRISMELFIKNNPNIDTDPNAIEKVFNFITKQSQQVRAQQEAYHSYKNDPKNDPSAFPAYWAGEAIKRGYVTPQIVTGEAKGSKPNPANVQALLDKYK